MTFFLFLNEDNGVILIFYAGSTVVHQDISMAVFIGHHYLAHCSVFDMNSNAQKCVYTLP